MRTKFVAVAGLLAIGTVSEGAELLRYSFGATGQETTAETGLAYNPTVTGLNFTVTPIRDLNGQVGIEISSAATTPVGAPFLRVDPQGNSTSGAAAVTAGKYFEFTITPDANYSLNLDSLTFDVTRGGGSTPRGFVLRGSGDAFGADLAGGDLATSRPTYTPMSVTLPAAYDDLTGATTFRFYVYAPAAGNSIDWDNIVVNGSVSAVPEPATSVLILGGALAMGAGWRRRRQA